MAKKDIPTGNRRQPKPSGGVVRSVKRSGPGAGFWIGLGLLVVVGMAVLSWQMNKPKPVATRIDPTLPKLKAEGYVIGSPAAPVEIVEFADFECPSCGQFATLTEPDVRNRLVKTGQLRMRFMDFPLEMHRNTWAAHNAAACANEQGKFWEMHDLLFANQDRWNGETTSRPNGPIADLAKGIGLDMSRFNSCVDSEKFRANIQANMLEGDRRHVNQTPSFVVGDRLVPGGMTYDSFKRVVDSVSKLPAAPAAGDTAKKGT